jgi:hypothetical protein
MLRLRPKSSPFCHPDSMGAFAINIFAAISSAGSIGAFSYLNLDHLKRIPGGGDEIA